MNARFEYLRPRDLGEALRILDGRAGEAHLLAGGHALFSLLAAREARPGVLVDLRGVAGLDSLTDADDGLHIGALVTHRRVLERPWTAMLEETAAGIGDGPVRESGTIGGSVVHAHPASDWAAVLLALRARLVCRSVGGERVISAADFFVGPFTTALRPSEVLTEIRLPPKAPGGGAAYCKGERGPDGYAATGVCARVVEVDGRITLAGIGMTGVPHPMAATEAEAALVGRAPTEETFVAAAEAAAAQSFEAGDASGSLDETRAMVRELTLRAIRLAHERSVATARAARGR